jgi:hypothetical protein
MMVAFEVDRMCTLFQKYPTLLIARICCMLPDGRRILIRLGLQQHTEGDGTAKPIALPIVFVICSAGPDPGGRPPQPPSTSSLILVKISQTQV